MVPPILDIAGPVISGVFVVIASYLTVSATKKNNEAQAKLQAKSADSAAFEIAEGIYLKSIEQLQAENASLRRKVEEHSKELEYLRRVLKSNGSIQ